MAGRARHQAGCTAALLWLLCACGSSAPRDEADGPYSLQAMREAGLSPTIRALADTAHERIEEHVDTERMSMLLKSLAARPHHAGSPADLGLANMLHGTFTAAGLESRIEEYEVLLPYPEEVVAELLRPVAFRANLSEEPLQLDYDTHTSLAVEPFLAFAADGEVTAPLVYVNYGRQADFDALARLGVDCKGRLGIVRSGAITASSKAYNAARANMVGLLVYTDPSDFGYRRGDPYPKGPWLPDSGVRRDSLLDMSVRPGDPLTPGTVAVRNAPRKTLEEAEALSKIPAAPLSAQDARPFLENLKGVSVPEGWQGGLPFTYHVGGTDDVLVRLQVRSGWRVRKIWNVIATLRGSAFPDDWILVGSHRDAWVHGAVDAGSGTVTLVETARVLGALSREGLPPSRSVVFCSWDASRFGLMGSTEFVEAQRAALERSAILYLDLDAELAGEGYDLRGSPPLDMLALGARAALADAWTQAAAEQTRRGFTSGTLGGDGDFLAFIQDLGLPCMAVRGRAPCGVVDTLYDTYGWMQKHGDPGMQTHGRLVREIAGLVWRSATASMVPVRFEAWSTWISESLAQLSPPLVAEEREALDRSLSAYAEAARSFDRARRAFLSTDPDPVLANRFDRAVRQIHLRFRRSRKTPGAEFYGNTLLAPDAQTARGVVSLPFLRAALAEGDPDAVRAAINELTSALSDATPLLRGLADRLRESGS